MTSELPAGLPKDLPRIIGGYRLLRELTRSDVGPVLVARDRATGQNVALTVLKPEWACLPAYVARVAHDAFAASHAAHPNVARVRGLGEAVGRVYFASEYVDGTTLEDRVKAQGPLAPREAVAFLVQAARGLQYLHEQGMNHGAVGPDTIVVDGEGVTRLTGLGLSTTPATMAAEFARRASKPIELGEDAQADANAEPSRADLRALGRTLVHLITGRTPGENPDVATLVSLGLPTNLVELVRKLIDPTPGRGFADAGQVIAALERVLDGRKPGSNTPGEEHARILSESLAAFRGSPSAVLRRRILIGAIVACAAFVLLALLARRPLLATSLLGLGLLTGLARFLVRSLTRGTELYPKLRALAFESRSSDWLTALAGGAAAVAALVALQQHWAWVWMSALAVFAAVALHLTLDRQAEAERRGAVEEARELLKRLRLQGVSETVLRRFVRTASGADWEEFYETLVGAGARRDARDEAERGWRGLLGKRVGRFGDFLAPRVDARREAIRRERESTFFQVVQERDLTSRGVNLLTARRRSRRTAAALAAVSAEVCAASRNGPGRSDGPEVEHLTIARALRQAAEAPEETLVDREEGTVAPGPSILLELAMGPRTRFVAGSVLLAGCFVWVHQNGIATGADVEQIRDVAAKAISDPEQFAALRDVKVDVRLPARTESLRLPLVPRPILGLFNGFHAGGAGLILILSAFAGGVRLGYFALPGAAVALLGPSLGVPPIGALDRSLASTIVGAVVAGAGLFVARDDR